MKTWTQLGVRLVILGIGLNLVLTPEIAYSRATPNKTSRTYEKRATKKANRSAPRTSSVASRNFAMVDPNNDRNPAGQRYDQIKRSSKPCPYRDKIALQDSSNPSRQSNKAPAPKRDPRVL